MDKLLLFALLLCVSIVTTDGGQAATDMAFHFGVLSFNPVRGVFPMKGTFKESKRPVLKAAQIGGDGEERVVVLRLEYNAIVCPDPPSSDEPVIDLDPTALQMYPTIPDVGGGHNDSSRKVNGIAVRRGRAGGGGGGGGPGGGGEDPDEEGPDDNSDTDRDSDTDSDGDERIEAVGEILSKFQKKRLHKLAKISIFIASQTGVSLVAIPRDKLTFIVYLVAAFSAFSYFFCLFSIISEKESVAAITAVIGTLFAAVGFLLAMCMIVFPTSV